jgi:ubiquinone/menaquinone biosynthesis C-methylase UbiE/uncharacterized protein YbaR (Trm112 family)
VGRLEAVHSGADAVEIGALRCPEEDLQFPVIDGVPMLVRADRIGRVESFAGSFSGAWEKDGWGCPDEFYLLNLPYRDSSRRRVSEWRVKARSMEALLRILDLVPSSRVVDLGCGNGWLAHRLALSGREIYAVDILRDDRLGLAAAKVFLRAGPHFERIWGELDRPPFRNESMDAIVCNASLHYSIDVDRVMSECVRVLRPGGIFIVLNSPVHNDVKSAARAQRDFRARLERLGANAEVVTEYHHFTKPLLEAAISKSFGNVVMAPFDPGTLFRWTRRLKGIAIGIEFASFPIFYATKT